MNYHKKIQSIGFKRCRPLVVCQYHPYTDNIDGLRISEVSDFIKTCDKRNKNNKILISEFNISGTEDELDKIQTYYWRVSDNLTIYISIYNQNFYCFGFDQTIEDKPHKWDKKCIIRDQVFLISMGILNTDFWKTILNNLCSQYKRDVILKQII
jgi:hypothetical protein